MSDYTAVVVDNDRALLGGALSSVRRQSLAPASIVVLGGGDKPDEAAQVGADWVTMDGAGSACLVDVLRSVSTEYVAFLRSSDEWLPYSVAERIRRMQAQPEAVIVHTDCYVCAEGASRMMTDYHTSALGDDPEVTLLGRNPVRLSTVLLRREAAVRLLEGMGDAVVGWYLRACGKGCLGYEAFPTAKVAPPTDEQRNLEGEFVCEWLSRPGTFADRSPLERHRARGKVLLDRGLYREAIWEFEQAVKIDRSDAEALFDLGLALLALRHLGYEIERLWDPLEKALALRPDDPAVLYHLFLGLVLGGDVKGGMRRAEQLRERFPGYSGLALCVEACVTLASEPRKAVAMLSEAASCEFPREGRRWRPYEMKLMEESLGAFLARGYYDAAHAVLASADCGLQLRLAQADIGRGRYLEGAAHAAAAVERVRSSEAAARGLTMLSFAFKAAGWPTYVERIEALRTPAERGDHLGDEAKARVA